MGLFEIIVFTALVYGFLRLHELNLELKDLSKKHSDLCEIARIHINDLHDKYDELM